MDITRLPRGEKAPIECDCVTIDETPQGRFQITATAMNRELNSFSFISTSGAFPTVEEAEQAGIAWLVRQGATAAIISFDE